MSFDVILSYDILELFTVPSFVTFVEVASSPFEVLTIANKHAFRRNPPAGKSSERLHKGTCFQ